MEWVDNASSPSTADVDTSIKHKYKNWEFIEERYGHVVGCRYRVSACRESKLYGRCCHACEKEETCKHKCLSTIEDCESQFPGGDIKNV